MVVFAVSIIYLLLQVQVRTHLNISQKDINIKFLNCPMAPAVALAIPQYTHVNDKKEGAEFTMDSTLDFDLLAEYLLEDVEAGGFDFR